VKIGDLVKPYDKFIVEHVYYGIGVILDSYEDEDGLYFVEVQWIYSRQWFSQDEVKVISESK
jgi:hypothetical protein